MRYPVNMPVLSVEQIRALEEDLMVEHALSESELMTIAAEAFCEVFLEQFPSDVFSNISVYCGPGKNGGDGYAIARILFESGYNVVAFDASFGSKLPKIVRDMRNAFKRKRGAELIVLEEGAPINSFGAITIDALFGIGLNRPLEGPYAELAFQMNHSDSITVGVDVPSGLFVDKPAEGEVVVCNLVFTFFTPKLSFLLPGQEKYITNYRIISFLDSLEYARFFDYSTAMLLPEGMMFYFNRRKRNDHKGTFGHALIVAGAHGKIGSSLLAGKACLRSGAGLLTIHTPGCGYQILQIGFPEAMVEVDPHQYIVTELRNLDQYQAIGVGPGLGKDPKTAEALADLLQKVDRPMVLDADALNLLSEHPDWWDFIPKYSILTPHPGEFERLFGKTEHGFELLALLREKAAVHQIVIVLKGGDTMIAIPSEEGEAEVYFSTAGNPGMSTAGMGDVLTGIITSFLAQGYEPQLAACLGVMVHAAAGDIAVGTPSRAEALIASDVIDHLNEAFAELKTGGYLPLLDENGDEDVIDPMDHFSSN